MVHGDTIPSTGRLYFSWGSLKTKLVFKRSSRACISHFTPSLFKVFSCCLKQPVLPSWEGGNAFRVTVNNQSQNNWLSKLSCPLTLTDSVELLGTSSAFFSSYYYYSKTKVCSKSLSAANQSNALEITVPRCFFWSPYAKTLNEKVCHEKAAHGRAREPEEPADRWPHDKAKRKLQTLPAQLPAECAKSQVLLTQKLEEKKKKLKKNESSSGQCPSCLCKVMCHSQGHNKQAGEEVTHKWGSKVVCLAEWGTKWSIFRSSPLTPLKQNCVNNQLCSAAGLCWGKGKLTQKHCC